MGPHGHIMGVALVMAPWGLTTRIDVTAEFNTPWITVALAPCTPSVTGESPSTIANGLVTSLSQWPQSVELGPPAKYRQVWPWVDHVTCFHAMPSSVPVARGLIPAGGPATSGLGTRACGVGRMAT